MDLNTFISCRRFEPKLSMLLDGRLDSGSEREVRLHLERCARCREIYTELRLSTTELRALEGAKLDQEFNRVLFDRMYRESQKLRRVGLRTQYAWAAAVAAALVAGVYLGHSARDGVVWNKIDSAAGKKSPIAVVTPETPEAHAQIASGHVPLHPIDPEFEDFLHQHLYDVETLYAMPNQAAPLDPEIIQARLAALENDARKLRFKVIPAMAGSMQPTMDAYCQNLERCIAGVRQELPRDASNHTTQVIRKHFQMVNQDLKRVGSMLGDGYLVISNEPLRKALRILEQRYPSHVRIERTRSGDILIATIKRAVLEMEPGPRAVIEDAQKRYPGLILIAE